MGVKVLFDPFIRPNVLAKEVNLDSILCDYIFVSHGHEDHVADLEFFARKTGAKVVGCWELIQWVNAQGISNTHAMNIGGIYDFGFAEAKMVLAVHSNSLPNQMYAGTAAGYIIKNKDCSFYFAGDTALTFDMKLIAESYKLDFAFLPIGGNFTMNTDDAVKAAQFINCDRIIGMHYDTFDVIKINQNISKTQFKDKGMTLDLLTIGETKIY